MYETSPAQGDLHPSSLKPEWAGVCTVCVCVRFLSAENYSQSQPAEVTTTSVCFATVLISLGGLSLALNTNTAIERAISGLSQKIVQGGMNQHM